MVTPNPGDRIISKEADAHYTLYEAEAGGRPRLLRTGITELDDAKNVARSELAPAGRIWYRDHRDAPEHLELLQ